MSDRPPRRRKGLQGLPVNNGEVWAFDILREGGGNVPPMRPVIILWLIGAVLVGVAIWGRSLILGICGGLAVAAATWWTLSRWRSSLRARRQD